MTFSASGSVSFGGDRGISSRFGVEGGKPSFEFKIGGGDEDVRGSAGREASGETTSKEASGARSEQFLEDVKAVKSSSAKRALIDNFVKDAVKENKAAEKDAEAKPAKADGAGKAEGGEKAGKAKGKGEELGFEPAMKELQGLAETIDKSKLPEKTQGKLLDGIAQLASDLKDAKANGGDLRETALNGLADLAQTLDKSKGGEKAKGAVMDEIAQSLTDVATGEAGAEEKTCGCGEKAEKAGAEKAAGSEKADRAGKSGCGDESGASARAASENSDAAWSHSVKDGKAELNLGDKYTISANEDDASWTVKNNETGATTRIHGDPHVDVGADGQNDWDFKKDTSFQLDDGTKISVGTVDAGNGTTLSSSLTITNGDKAMEVSGLGSDKDGKSNLKVVQSDAGETLDDLTQDGFTVHEDGANWASANGARIDQAAINKAEQAV